MFREIIISNELVVEYETKSKQEYNITIKEVGGGDCLDEIALSDKEALKLIEALSLALTETSQLVRKQKEN